MGISGNFDSSPSLEARLTVVFDKYSVSRKNRRGIEALLAPLKKKHLPSYEHCIRVGLISAEMANFMKLDVRALLYAGLLHDCGKALAPPEVLTKTVGWTANDARIMRRHVRDGHRMLRGIFDFPAEIIVWHHHFQKAGYPCHIPASLHGYSAGTKALIPEYGRILAIADVYDALHRVNDHSGELKALTGEEIRTQIMNYNPDRIELIEELYRVGVMTTEIADSTGRAFKPADGYIYISSKIKHAEKWRKLAEKYPLSCSWIWMELDVTKDEEVSEAWQQMIEDCSRSSVLIIYLEEGEQLKGGLVEIGAVLANRGRIFSVGVLPDLSIGNRDYADAIERFPNMKVALLAALQS